MLSADHRMQPGRKRARPFLSCLVAAVVVILMLPPSAADETEKRNAAELPLAKGRGTCDGDLLLAVGADGVRKLPFRTTQRVRVADVSVGWRCGATKARANICPRNTAYVDVIRTGSPDCYWVCFGG